MEPFTGMITIESTSEAINKLTRQGEAFKLPASTQIMSTTKLDYEENDGKIDASFLHPFKRSKRKKKYENKKPAGINLQLLDSHLASNTKVNSKTLLSAELKNADDWHDISEVRMTPELERDLRLIENRAHLDPKRFYKSTGTGRKKGQLPTKFHMGTVVEGAHEFYSSRLTRRERRKSIVNEVMADKRIVNYAKNKFKSLQQAKTIKKRVIDPAAKRRH